MSAVQDREKEAAVAHHLQDISATTKHNETRERPFGFDCSRASQRDQSSISRKTIQVQKSLRHCIPAPPLRPQTFAGVHTISIPSQNGGAHLKKATIVANRHTQTAAMSRLVVRSVTFGSGVLRSRKMESCRFLRRALSSRAIPALMTNLRPSVGKCNMRVPQDVSGIDTRRNFCNYIGIQGPPSKEG